ncbi:MAG: hypothetical protein MJ202_04010 [Lentisphaeria bacterium]|nr:hypothetical protein [Lentisphaeria bacterium]
MRKVLFLLFCVALGLFAGPKAEWIIYPEKPAEGLNKERFLRTEFELADKPVKEAFINYIIDDTGFAFLNGKNVTQKSYANPLFPKSRLYDVTDLLKSGRNAIGVIAINQAGNGGTILHLEITYKDGTIQEVFTDKTWKLSKENAKDWEMPGFDDKEWKTPNSNGDYNADPWVTIYDMVGLYAHDDATVEIERRQQKETKIKQLLEQLAQEPDEQAKITYVNGDARFDIGGKLYRPVLYNSNFGWRDTPNFREKIANFEAADMNLISFGIEADKFWKGTGKFDYKALNQALADAFVMAPNARFIFDVGFSHGPRWWNREHPEELVKYASVDTEHSSGDCIGNYAAPSYASELWLKEASEVVRRIVEYIESKPYAKHVFGYRLDAGVYMEWHYYGMALAMPDISDPMIKFFRNFLREKYDNDVEKLRAAWMQPEVTFDGALPPPKEVRLDYLDDALREPVRHAWNIDFLQCIQSSLKNALLTLNKTAKEASKGRALVGNYCGYFFGMSYTAEGWHLVNDELIRSPYVDFQVSPCCYGSFFRGLGNSQMARSLVSSYRLHNKITIFEADGRTCLLAPGSNQRYANTIQESIATLSRDLAQGISKGCGYWYYDFGRDWYNHPEILKFFHNVAPVYDAVKDFTSAAEIAFIGDWESAYYHAIQKYTGGPQTYVGINYITHELKRAGLQFDAYSFGDIDNPALQDYKVYIFPQLCYVTPEKLAKLNALKKAGKTFIFMGTPGWLTPEGPDTDSIYKTTGIRTNLLERSAKITTMLNDGSLMDAYGLDEQGMNYSPVLDITDSDAVVLGTVKVADGKRAASYAKKKNADGTTTYLCSAPVINTVELRKIAKDAGVHIYCDSENGVVYANNSMISFHTATPGEYTLHAKAPVKWTMVYPEKRSFPEVQADLTFQAPQTDTYIFVIEQ